MNISYCFPSAIFNTVDENLADQLLPIAKKYLNDENYINKDIKIYKTTWFAEPKTYEEFNFFSNYVSNIGKMFLKKQGYKTDNINFDVSFFLNEMHYNQYHPVHTHANNDLSGIIYLQTPPGSGPIIFHDPKPRRYFIQREIEFPNDSNLNTISITPMKGMLLMWESWLEHSVEKTENEDLARISLAFNLSSKIKM
jgi:uncharacterized protein (TIGR02466 family)